MMNSLTRIVRDFILIVGVAVIVLQSVNADIQQQTHSVEENKVAVSSGPLPFDYCGPGTWNVNFVEISPYPIIKVGNKRETLLETII